jgi:hypothetical protein
LFATSGNGSVSVGWMVPAYIGRGPLTSYTVTASPGGKICTTPNAATMRCTFTGLSRWQRYAFDVVATNGSGTGPPALLPYPVYPVGASRLKVHVPVVVQIRVPFTVLAYGATPGTKVTFGVPGSSPTCVVDVARQCWRSAKVNKTGKWTALATTSKAIASEIFYAPSVSVPLQVEKNETMVISISRALPGCPISMSVSGKTYTTKASKAGTATIKAKVTAVGVLTVKATIDGTIFKPYSVEVT